jgi:asparagine synthase (glutamine-hydrolysing)
MCGISGVVLRSSEQASRSDLMCMAAEMAHRGPDAEGCFVFENVGLAHRRLKIIDLSEAGNQPLFNEDGKVGIVFNGEIYNFSELRVELEGLGHQFRSHSDTEVIVHAFEQWGEKAFYRLNGIFAFALWDGRDKASVIYLVRDRFGAKPLFYSIRDGRLAFASELKPLLKLSWIRKQIDEEALFYFLKFSHVPGERSILGDVRQLAPGTCLRFETGQSDLKKFWDSTELHHRKKIENLSEQEWLEELDRVLKRVVRRQIVSDVPIGCFLSGGIDSSLLAATYSELGAGRIKTFTIGYKETEFDETPFANQVALAFRTEHYELIASPKDFIEFIPDIPKYFDQPFADPTLLSSLLLSRFARQRVTVALSGDGGDELFFGYPHQRALLHFAPLNGVPPFLRSALFDRLGSVFGGIDQRIKKFAEILQFRDEAEFMQYFIGTIGPMRMDRLMRLVTQKPDISTSLFKVILDQLPGLSWTEKVEQIFIKTFLVDTVLSKTDRAGMAFGLEARVPFLDDEIAELSARIPFSFKYRKFKSKYILRKLLEKKLFEMKLPVDISKRSKQGFSIPLRDWLRGDLKYLMDEYLNETRLKREGHFDVSEVKEVIRAHLSERMNYSHLLWSLISFQMWKERYAA